MGRDRSSGVSSFVFFVILIAVAAYFFLASNMMMTTFIFNKADKKTQVINGVYQKMSEQSAHRVTVKKTLKNSEGDKVLFTSVIDISKDGDVYTVYAESSGEDSSQKIISYFVGGLDSDGTLYVQNAGMKNQFHDLSINVVLQKLTGGSSLYFGKSYEPVVNSVDDILAFDEFTEEYIKDYTSTLLFSFSPFKLGVNYRYVTEYQDEKPLQFTEYDLSLFGRLLAYNNQYVVTETVDESVVSKTYNDSISYAKLDSVSKLTTEEMALWETVL